MGNDIQKGTVYATGGVGGQGSITSANLNAHVDDATIKATFVTAKAARAPGALTDNILLESSGALYKMLLSTLQPLLNPPGTPYSVYPGAIIQTVAATPYVTNTNITTVLPFDDTIPQVSEGTEILTLNIAPRFSNSQIRLVSTGMGADSGVFPWVAALYRTSVANALQSTVVSSGAANFSLSYYLNYVDSPATTSTTTYSVRVGPGQTGTLRMNGNTSGRAFGGTASCTLVAQEIKV